MNQKEFAEQFSPMLVIKIVAINLVVLAITYGLGVRVGFLDGAAKCRKEESKIVEQQDKSRIILNEISKLKLNSQYQLAFCNAIGESVVQYGHRNYCLDCHLGH
jgi:hypothetical protein